MQSLIIFTTLLLAVNSLINWRLLDLPDDLISQIMGNMTEFEVEARSWFLSVTREESDLNVQVQYQNSQAEFLRIQSLGDPSQIENQISLPEQMQLHILEAIKSRFNLTKIQMASVIHALGPLLHSSRIKDLLPIIHHNLDLLECPFPDLNNTECDAKAKYRAIDGSCNNLDKPLQGRSFRPLVRFLESDYGDGIESPRQSESGAPLPNPRFISRTLSQGKVKMDAFRTFLHMTFGQFLDHDLSLTALSMLKTIDEDGNVSLSKIKCGSDGCDTNGSVNAQCLPIPIPPGDKFFTKKKCLMFVRSLPSSSDGCRTGPREQLNKITSYLDASMIYGSTKEKMDKLRDWEQPERGLLYTENHPQGMHGLLPFFNDPGCKNVSDKEPCFKAGDARINEHIGLMALHTTYHRYHNVMATKLGNINRHWSGDRIFQETRKIVGAIWQYQVFHEYLPITLGPAAIKKYKLKLRKSGYFRDYNTAVNVETANVFATSAFRFGHSTIPEHFKIINRNGTVEDNFLLSKVFNSPKTIYKKYASGASQIDGIMRGQYMEPMIHPDRQFTSQVSDKLFTDDPPNHPGTDLLSINIHRGRDHGLPGYTAWRSWCKLPVPESFKELKDIKSKDRKLLKKLYESVDDIDLFTAAISEKPVKGGVVGPTFACIIGQQFKNIRFGDRFWFERKDSVTQFTSAQLKEIRKILISRVICDTGDYVDHIPRYVLLRPNTKIFSKGRKSLKKYGLVSPYVGWKNLPEECSKLPNINLRKWKEMP